MYKFIFYKYRNFNSLQDKLRFSYFALIPLMFMASLAHADIQYTVSYQPECFVTSPTGAIAPICPTGYTLVDQSPFGAEFSATCLRDTEIQEEYYDRRDQVTSCPNSFSFVLTQEQLLGGNNDSSSVCGAHSFGADWNFFLSQAGTFSDSAGGSVDSCEVIDFSTSPSIPSISGNECTIDGLGFGESVLSAWFTQSETNESNVCNSSFQAPDSSDVTDPAFSQAGAANTLAALEQECTNANGIVLDSFITDNVNFRPSFGWFVSCQVDKETEVVLGEWSSFIDGNVIRSCDASCTQEIEQTRECIGGDVGEPGCLGDTTQIVERSCSPGIGMCPINAETVGMITNNPLIEPDSPEESAGTALENICPQLGFGDQVLTPAQQDLLARCTNIINESDNARQLTSVQNIIADEVSSQAVDVRRVNLSQLSNIASRLAALRPALTQSSQSQSNNWGISHPLPSYAGRSPALQMYEVEQLERFGISMNQERGGAAGDDEVSESSGRWGVFINGLYGRGDRANTNTSSSFDFDTQNITIGADYLWDVRTILGFAIGYGSSDTTFSNNTGRLENDTKTLSVYGTRYFDSSWFLDGVIGYGSGDYTSYRNIAYVADGVSIVQTAKARPEGDQMLFSLGVGKTISTSSAIDFDFSVRANYLDASVDRFAETALNSTAPGFGLALEIDQQNIESLTSDFSLNVSKAFSQNYGVLVPSFGLSWVHEFEEGSDYLRARFVNDPFSINFVQSGLDVAGGGLPTIFEVALESNDSNYGRAQLGMNLLLPNSWSFSFLVNKTLGLDSIDYEYYSIGLRKSF